MCIALFACFIPMVFIFRSPVAWVKVPQTGSTFGFRLPFIYRSNLLFTRWLLRTLIQPYSYAKVFFVTFPNTFLFHVAVLGVAAIGKVMVLLKILFQFTSAECDLFALGTMKNN
jgi:hypothetical protein